MPLPVEKEIPPPVQKVSLPEPVVNCLRAYVDSFFEEKLLHFKMGRHLGYSDQEVLSKFGDIPQNLDDREKSCERDTLILAVFLFMEMENFLPVEAFESDVGPFISTGLGDFGIGEFSFSVDDDEPVSNKPTGDDLKLKDYRIAAEGFLLKLWREIKVSKYERWLNDTNSPNIQMKSGMFIIKEDEVELFQEGVARLNGYEIIARSPHDGKFLIEINHAE